MIVAAYQGFSPEGNIESALAKVDETLAKAGQERGNGCISRAIFPGLQSNEKSSLCGP